MGLLSAIGSSLKTVVDHQRWISEQFLDSQKLMIKSLGILPTKDLAEIKKSERCLFVVTGGLVAVAAIHSTVKSPDEEIIVGSTLPFALLIGNRAGRMMKEKITGSTNDWSELAIENITKIAVVVGWMFVGVHVVRKIRSCLS